MIIIKNDEQEPSYFSRVVAHQFKAMDRSGVFHVAPDSPLHALRAIISMALTKYANYHPLWDPTSCERAQLNFVNAKRTYFNAKLDRDVIPCFAEVLLKAADKGKMCGERLRHIYTPRPTANG